MGSSKFLLFLILNLFCMSSSNHTNLVYTHCADEKLDNGIYSQTLSNLFKTLSSKSSTLKFYRTSVGDGPSAINGTFQCRGDISNHNCKNCIQKAPEMAQMLCGHAVAVRVQLKGCHMRYDISGFPQASGAELLYEVCGSTRNSGTGFKDGLEMALGEIVKSLESGDTRFYAGGYESISVLGQCENDLSNGECVNCVKNAIERAKSDCVDSISAQIYLKNCHISYAYYPRGIPAKKSQSPGTGRYTRKTVALLLGGLAGMAIGVACLLFAKSAFKKKTLGYEYET